MPPLPFSGIAPPPGSGYGRGTMNLLLFICTGNYYRSRFAEAVFNHHAKQRGLPWRAFSRGLAIHLAPPGISPHTREALAAREIDESHTGSERVSLAEPDLAAAHRVIALQDEEHRPMIRAAFPHWEERVTFWDVPDLPADPAFALPSIERRVAALLGELS